MSLEKIEEITLKMDEIKNSLKELKGILKSNKELGWLQLVNKKVHDIAENFKKFSKTLIPCLAKKGELLFEEQLEKIRAELLLYTHFCKQTLVYAKNYPRTLNHYKAFHKSMQSGKFPVKEMEAAFQIKNKILENSIKDLCMQGESMVHNATLQIISFNKSLGLFNNLQKKIGKIHAILSLIEIKLLNDSSLNEFTALEKKFKALLDNFNTDIDPLFPPHIIQLIGQMIILEKNCLSFTNQYSNKMELATPLWIPPPVFIPERRLDQASKNQPLSIRMLRTLFNQLKSRFMHDIPINPFLQKERPQLMLIEEELKEIEQYENKIQQLLKKPKEAIFSLNEKITEFICKIDFQNLAFYLSKNLTKFAESSTELMKETLNNLPDFSEELEAIRHQYERLIEAIKKGEESYSSAYQSLKNSIDLFEAKREWINTSSQIAGQIKSVVDLATCKLDETYQTLLDMKNFEQDAIDNPGDLPMQNGEPLLAVSTFEEINRLEDMKATFQKRLGLKSQYITRINQLNALMKDQFKAVACPDLLQPLSLLTEKNYFIYECGIEFMDKRQYTQALGRQNKHIQKLQHIYQALYHSSVEIIQQEILNYTTKKADVLLELEKIFTLTSQSIKAFNLIKHLVDKSFPSLSIDVDLSHSDLINHPAYSRIPKIKTTLGILKKITKKFLENNQTEKEIKKAFISVLKQLKIPFFSRITLPEIPVKTRGLSLNSVIRDLTRHAHKDSESLYEMANRLDNKLTCIKVHPGENCFKANVILANKSGLIDYKDANENLHTILRFMTKNSPGSCLDWLEPEAAQDFIKNSQFLLDLLAKSSQESRNIAAVMINNLTILKTSTPDYTQKDHDSIDKFLTESLPVLLENISPARKKLSVVKMAKQTFSHRHNGRRMLADILQCVFCLFPIIMAVKHFRGENLFFSTAKTRREETVDSAFKDLTVF